MTENSLSTAPKKILVASDLSAGSDRAMDRGIQLAAAWGAALTVLHVLDKKSHGQNMTGNHPGKGHLTVWSGSNGTCGPISARWQRPKCASLRGSRLPSSAMWQKKSIPT